MGFVSKEWKNRITEYPTRRALTKEDGTSELVTVSREEGSVSQEGDAFNAETMNDLEARILAAIGDGDIPAALGTDIVGAITSLNSNLWTGTDPITGEEYTMKKFLDELFDWRHPNFLNLVDSSLVPASDWVLNLTGNVSVISQPYYDTDGILRCDFAGQNSSGVYNGYGSLVYKKLVDFTNYSSLDVCAYTNYEGSSDGRAMVVCIAANPGAFYPDTIEQRLPDWASTATTTFDISGISGEHYILLQFPDATYGTFRHHYYVPTLVLKP